MDNELPRWLTDDRVRRRKQIKQVRHSISIRRWKKRLESPTAIVIVIIIALLYPYLIASATTTYVAPEVTQIEREVQEVLVAVVTGYTSSEDETDDTPFITASGARTASEHIACPIRYPFGTKVEIEGEVYVCEDRMNRRYQHQDRFDRWFETKEEAFEWGLQELEVIILTSI